MSYVKGGIFMGFGKENDWDLEMGMIAKRKVGTLWDWRRERMIKIGFLCN